MGAPVPSVAEAVLFVSGERRKVRDAMRAAARSERAELIAQFEHGANDGGAEAGGGGGGAGDGV